MRSFICSYCGKEFESRRKCQKYCSRECVANSLKKNFCWQCGKYISRKADKTHSGMCRECSLEFRKEHPRPRVKHIKDIRGYLFIRKPNHPRANNGYVGEHILVWEEANKQRVPSGWIVHHLNGIKSDNRPENLMAMPRKSHHAHLQIQTMQKRIRHLENEVRALKAQQILPL